MDACTYDWRACMKDHSPTRKREYVDFASVPPSQWAIHDRLTNWAQWARGSSGREDGESPMFRLHRSDGWYDRAYGAETVVPINKDEALKLHFAIIHPTFDPQCRRALQWYYLRNGRHPSQQAREMGFDLQALAEKVKAARALLLERGV